MNRAEGPYVLGLDGGTEGVRAAIVNSAGEVASFARADYPTAHPHQGWAEQDTRDWWRATVEATRHALAEGGIPRDSVRAVSAACTSCSVAVTDADGVPLRPALIWMDVRAVQEAKRIGATGHPALKYSGFTKTSAEWLLSKALWLASHEPEVYRKAAHLVEYVDWLGHRLTGQWAASINTAAIRAYHDRDAGGWPVDLYEAVGLVDLMDRLPERVVDMGDFLGELAPDSAEELGLPAGIPVAEGGADAFVGMVGLDVVTPGRVALITGSSHLQLAQTAAPTHAPGMFGAYTDAVIPGQYTIEGGQVSTGSVVRWLVTLAAGQPQGAQAMADAYRQLEAKAVRIPPGSEGVLALDFWQGNRTPYIDAEARGMLWGLSLSHQPAHLYRAAIEAVCFGTENVFRTFRANGHEITDVAACGGALHSELWLQTHANVSNLAISITAVPEAVSLGAAILASVAAGFYPSVEAAAHAMVRVVRRVEPDPEAHSAYGFYFDRYVASYEAMKTLMHEVVQHVNA